MQIGVFAFSCEEVFNSLWEKIVKELQYKFMRNNLQNIDQVHKNEIYRVLTEQLLMISRGRIMTFLSKFIFYKCLHIVLEGQCDCCLVEFIEGR